MVPVFGEILYCTLSPTTATIVATFRDLAVAIVTHEMSGGQLILGLALRLSNSDA
jgi:hypothetical protein